MLAELVEEQEQPKGPCPVVADRAGMPFCCGIDILGNFNGGYRAIDTRKPIEKQLDEIHGLLLATTVIWQQDSIAALRKHGFQPLLVFWNNVHARKDAPKGNLVTLWVKASNEAQCRVMLRHVRV